MTVPEDAFGTSIGNERIGLYNIDEVRGFGPDRGGPRAAGLYLGNSTIDSDRLVAGSTVRVGLSAQGYPFPTPAVIVDYELHFVGTRPVVSAVLFADPLPQRQPRHRLLGCPLPFPVSVHLPTPALRWNNVIDASPRPN
jgi:hypothetical protein